MHRKLLFNRLAALFAEAEMAMNRLAWGTATHTCRKILEELAKYAWAYKLYKDASEIEKQKSLKNLLEPLEKAVPKRLYVRMWFVKGLGDVGSHQGHMLTQEDAETAYAFITELYDYLVSDPPFSFMIENPRIEIDVSKDLNQLEFVYKNQHLRIQEPVLLWESQGGRDSIFAFDEQHSDYATQNFLEGKELTKSFRKWLGRCNRIHFGDIVILWDDRFCPWPPAIDSLFVGSCLLHDNDLSHLMHKCTSFAEIGCGTGFLSTLFCRYFEIKKVVMTDIEQTILDLAEFNLKSNCPDVDAQVLLGDGHKPLLVNDLECDVIVANPPYLTIGGLKTGSATRSTGLLEELLINFWQYSPSLVLNYSSCSRLRMNAVLSTQVKKGYELHERVISRKFVPFRIPGATRDDLFTLVSEGGLIDLQDESDRNAHQDLCNDNRGFRYWHEILVSIFNLKD